jgi:hypothetical protein
MKSFYIVVTKTSICKGNWGKGTSLKNALISCMVKKLSENFVIYQAIIKPEATQYQVENLCKCFNVNDWGGVNMYSNPSQKDLDMVKDLLLGWVVNEDFI